MSAYVTTGVPRASARRAVRGARTLKGATFRGFPAVAWSGQRGPTGVMRRHSVQIGRPHSVQESPVSRLGWR